MLASAGLVRLKNSAISTVVEIKAVCDTHKEALDRAVAAGDRKRPAWRLMRMGTMITATVIFWTETILMLLSSLPRGGGIRPWAVDTMNSGKHALVEVPAALTIEEAWQLVILPNAHRKTA